jgi:hypothetical protein
MAERTVEQRVEQLETDLRDTTAAFVATFTALLFESNIDKATFIENLKRFSGGIDKGLGFSQRFFHTYELIRAAAEIAQRRATGG